jgi:DNA-binding protein H-NS
MSAKLDGQIAKLQQQIAGEHARFINAAKAAVVAVLADYGLTLDDLTATKLTKELAKATKPPKAEKTATASTRMKATKPTKGKRQPAFKGPQPMKYADPNTGAQWSGFGRAPAWIAGEKDRTKFLINGAA